MSSYEIKPYTPDTRLSTVPTSTRPFAVAIAPPRSDDEYCRVRTARPTGGASIKAGSKDEAVERLQNTIDQWKRQYENDCNTTISTKPSPETVTFFIHPEYDGVIHPSKAFGTASLSSFLPNETGGNNTENTDAWAETRDVYDSYVNPLIEGGTPKPVLWLRVDKGTTIQQRWIARGDEPEDNLVQHTYNETGHRTEGPDTVDITKLVHLMHEEYMLSKQLLDFEFRSLENSPFHPDFEYPYLENTGHPVEVNGWTFDPDTPLRSDTWMSTNGTYAVHVLGGHGRAGAIRILDTRFSWESEGVAPNGATTATDDSELTLAEARTTAVKWMRQNNPERFSHPHTNPAIIEYSPPDGYRISKQTITEQACRLVMRAETVPEDLESVVVRFRGENVTGSTIGEHTILVQKVATNDETDSTWNPPENMEYDIRGNITRGLDELTNIASDALVETCSESCDSVTA